MPAAARLSSIASSLGIELGIGLGIELGIGLEIKLGVDTVATLRAIADKANTGSVAGQQAELLDLKRLHSDRA